jgi:hypothetical protein
MLLTAALLAAGGAACADGPGLKAGLWEVKVVHQLVDGKDMTAQLSAAQERMQQSLGSLSPAQRSQMEAMLGRQAAAGTGGGQRVCISAAMAARNKPMADPRTHCEPTSVNHAGNRTTYEFNCSSGGRTTVGKGESVASGDQVHTSVDMTVTDARGTHTMQSESQMSYLGGDCQGIKPADEMAR